MQITAVPIDQLVFDPSNARKHSEKNLAAIKGSLAKFGQQKPIVIDKNNVVIAGNGTLAGAKALGWSEIRCVKTELEGAAAIAYAVADNRAGELAEWDSDVLAKTLQGLKDEDFDLDAIGFSDDDLGQWLKDADQAAPGCDEDDVPEAVEPKTRLGDLYQLGEHRLLCGDSTDVLQVERLMGGAKADMVFTDPPYNIAYKGGSKKRNEISNDDMGDGFPDFMRAIYANLWVSTAPGAAIYISHADMERVTFTSTFVDAGFHLSSVIIWVKNNATFGRQDYFWKHEPILYGWNRRGAHQWHGPNNEETVWLIDRPSRSDEHPTMKPIELIERAINNSSISGSKVLDTFLGSGSTLIACEKTGRKCYGMEIDPHYCDVILARWAKFTGKEPVLING